MKILLLPLLVVIASCDNTFVNRINDLKRPVTVISKATDDSTRTQWINPKITFKGADGMIFTTDEEGYECLHVGDTLK